MNAPARRQNNPGILDLVQRPDVQAEFAKVLGREMTSEHFARIALTTLRKNPALIQKCEPISILTACMEAAQLQLSTDASAGEFYFVPYGRTCTGILGYRGMLRIAYRSGAVRKIDARVVYQGDDFDFEETQDGPRWSHKPYWQTGRDKGPILFSYAYAILPNGEIVFKVADQDQIKRSREKGNNGTWNKHEEAMTIKTAVRQLWKWIPKDKIAPTMAAAVEDDASREAGELPEARVSMDFARAYGTDPEPQDLGQLEAAPGLAPDPMDAEADSHGK